MTGHVDADGLPAAPTCPTRGADVTLEPTTTPEGVRIALVCPDHGAIAVMDPFA